MGSVLPTDPQLAMPTNKLGGNKAKRAKNDVKVKKELEFKEDGQEYGQVLRMLGNGRCDVQCFDGTKRMCHIRGKMRKKVFSGRRLIPRRRWAVVMMVVKIVVVVMVVIVVMVVEVVIGPRSS